MLNHCTPLHRESSKVKALGSSSHDGLVLPNAGSMVGKHFPSLSNTSMVLSPQKQLSMKTGLAKHADL